MIILLSVIDKTDRLNQKPFNRQQQDFSGTPLISGNWTRISRLSSECHITDDGETEDPGKKTGMIFPNPHIPMPDGVPH
jgi:hypothetical protein